MNPLPLTVDGVDLWLVRPSEISDSLIEEYRALMSPEERHREHRFCVQRDRRTHVVSRALVRTALSRYADIQPDQWRFSLGRYGRPAVAPDQLVAWPLSFNLSHTSDMVALAVRRSLAVGVDVENVGSVAVEIDLADRFFAVDEAAALRLTPPERQRHRFYEYWTLKESYLKARETGLSIPLDQFSFSFTAGSKVSLSISATLDDVASRWRLWQLWPSPEHVLALCVERSTPRERMVIRHYVPLRGDLAVAVTHTSYRDSDSP